MAPLGINLSNLVNQYKQINSQKSGVNKVSADEIAKNGMSWKEAEIIGMTKRDFEILSKGKKTITQASLDDYAKENKLITQDSEITPNTFNSFLNRVRNGKFLDSEATAFYLKISGSSMDKQKFMEAYDSFYQRFKVGTVNDTRELYSRIESPVDQAYMFWKMDIKGSDLINVAKGQKVPKDQLDKTAWNALKLVNDKNGDPLARGDFSSEKFNNAIKKFQGIFIEDELPKTKKMMINEQNKILDQAKNDLDAGRIFITQFNEIKKDCDAKIKAIHSLSYQPDGLIDSMTATQLLIVASSVTTQFKHGEANLIYWGIDNRGSSSGKQNRPEVRRNASDGALIDTHFVEWTVFTIATVGLAPVVNAAVKSGEGFKYAMNMFNVSKLLPETAKTLPVVARLSIGAGKAVLDMGSYTAATKVIDSVFTILE